MFCRLTSRSCRSGHSSLSASFALTSAACLSESSNRLTLSSSFFDRKSESSRRRTYFSIISDSVTFVYASCMFSRHWTSIWFAISP